MARPRKKSYTWILVSFCIVFAFLLLSLMLPVRVDIGIYVPFQFLIEGYEHPVALMNLLAVSLLFFPTYSYHVVSRKMILAILSIIYIPLFYFSFVFLNFSTTSDAVSEIAAGVYIIAFLSAVIMALSFAHAWRKSEKDVKVLKKTDLLDEF